MPNLLTWIRECDEALFARFFEGHPEVRVHNARASAFDICEMDGLLLTGGPDISADFLKQEIPDRSLIRNPEPERDTWEFAALHHALNTGKPVLAICKGMQLLNVALGGTLRLDIPGHDLPEMKSENVQPLRFATGAAHRFPHVNSSHHQAIGQTGAGLEIEAWCEKDDIIEQVRLREHPHCIAVQYHPERDLVYRGLFDDFLSRVGE